MLAINFVYTRLDAIGLLRSGSAKPSMLEPQSGRGKWIVEVGRVEEKRDLIANHRAKPWKSLG